MPSYLKSATEYLNNDGLDQKSRRRDRRALRTKREQHETAHPVS
jgi:hypothetical protein